MVTEKEMQNCKRQLEAIYGDMNEDELREKMTNVIDIMADLHKRAYAKSAGGDVWGLDVVNRLLRSARIQMATIAAMLEESEVKDDTVPATEVTMAEREKNVVYRTYQL